MLPALVVVVVAIDLVALVVAVAVAAAAVGRIPAPLNKCHRLYYIKANLSKNRSKVEMIRTVHNALYRIYKLYKKFLEKFF